MIVIAEYHKYQIKTIAINKGANQKNIGYKTILLEDIQASGVPNFEEILHHVTLSIAKNDIGFLTLTVKSVASRGGRRVLLNPTAAVQHVLEVTGIPAIIPIYSHL